MQLMRRADAEFGRDARVYLYPVLPMVLMNLGVVGVSAALVLVDWAGRKASSFYIAYVIAAVMLGLLLLFRGMTVARLRPSNWLAVLDQDHLWVQIRSYLNYQLSADDLTVARIDRGEIRSARLVSETTKTYRSGGPSNVTKHYVEFEISSDLSALEAAVSAEIKRPAHMVKTWYGRSSTLYSDYPVRIDVPPFVQVQWSATPDAAAFLKALSTTTPIEPPIAISQSLEDLRTLDRGAQEQRLRALDLSGRTVDAIYEARRLYGFDLAQAKGFIAALRDA